MDITLKHLRYFIALAEVKHFGHASEICAISQSALSQQIKDLEARLGTPLFERDARRVHLTPMGEVFEPRARDILRAMDDLQELVQSDLTKRPVRLGVIPTIAPYFLPRALKRLTLKRPDILLDIRETMTEHLLEELHQRKIDLALLALPVDSKGLSTKTLGRENFHMITAKSHPPSERLLLLEDGHCFRRQALEACALPSSAYSDDLAASTLATLVQMVGAGLGRTVLPDMALPVELRAAPVAATPLPAGKPGRTIGLVWRENTPQAELFSAIAQQFRAEFKRQPL